MRINVVVTKVFQSVAVRYLGRTLQVNIDCVPYTPNEIVVPQVEGIEVGEVIGAGMVAVVFEGMSARGPVVLKVKRRNIARRIEQGLRDARILLAVLHWCPGFGMLGLDTVHGEVQELLLGQLDFGQEVENQVQFKELMKCNADVVVPSVYPEWCTDDMIVMEKLTGTRHPTHKKAAAHAIASAIATSIVKGVVHADMHVGNVIFMDEKVGIIDFGLMLRLTPSELNAYTSIFTAGILKQFRAAADKALRFYMHPPDAMMRLPAATQVKLAADIADLYETAVQVRKSFGVGEVLAMAALVRPYGLTIAPIFYKTMMSMAAGDLLMKELTPEPLEFILAQMALHLLSGS
jgi:predicted unusual protein kinase regulating ubiquinone biosynthesis (AarF/ABC1/UbiB family)